jgi:hypothetical protein
VSLRSDESRSKAGTRADVPVVFKNVETDCSLCVDVAVIDTRAKRHFRRLKRIICTRIRTDSSSRTVSRGFSCQRTGFRGRHTFREIDLNEENTACKARETVTTMEAVRQNRQAGRRAIDATEDEAVTIIGGVGRPENGRNPFIQIVVLRACSTPHANR